MSTLTRGQFACGLWVLASTTMAFGAFVYERGGDPLLLAFGVFFGLIALATTNATLARHLEQSQQEVSLEHIVEVVDALHQGRRDVSRLH